MANGCPLPRQKPPYRLLLRNWLSPGDVLVSTAAVESLNKLYPGKYQIRIETSCDDVYANNPHVRRDLVPGSCAVFELDYPAIHRSGQMGTGHFMAAVCEALGEKLGVPLPLQVNHPSIYLTGSEAVTPVLPQLQGKPYFVVNAGTKSDFTCKRWGKSNYQAVVDGTADLVDWVQIGELHHDHPQLERVTDLRGKTTVRELFRLVYQGAGGIGPTTFLQHVHAALGRFYCCILGGREPRWWCDYPTQATFSTQGRLPCCSPSACWRSRVEALPDNDAEKNSSLCVLPVLNQAGETIPACMDAVTPGEVIHAIRTYLKHRRKENNG